MHYQDREERQEPVEKRVVCIHQRGGRQNATLLCLQYCVKVTVVSWLQYVNVTLIQTHHTYTHFSFFKTKVIIRVMIKCVINLILYCCLYSPLLSHVSFYPD